MKYNRGFQSAEIRLLGGNNVRKYDLQSNTALTRRYSYYETCASQHMFQGLLESITCPHHRFHLLLLPAMDFRPGTFRYPFSSDHSSSTHPLFTPSLTLFIGRANISGAKFLLSSSRTPSVLSSNSFPCLQGTLHSANHQML